MNGRIARLMTEFYSTPLALLPQTIAALSMVLERANAGVRLSADEIRAALAFDQEQENEQRAARRAGAAAPAQQPNTIAVLPVSGVIGHRAHLVEDSSSGVGTSTEILGAHFRRMVADPNVGAIVFDHDSPGGSVYGVAELSDQIHAARGTKPMVAVVNSLSASASYWLASAADEIVITPGGEAGSIGVWTAHQDWSKYFDQKGVKTTLVSAGKYKVEGHPYGPLEDEARAAIQDGVDKYYGMFVEHVARNRGDSAKNVRAGYGEGRVLVAKDAVAAKLANRVGTMDQVIAELQAKLGGSAGGPRARSRADAERELRLASLS